MTWMQFRLISIGLYIIMKCVAVMLTAEDFKKMINQIRIWKNEVKKETGVEL